MQTVQRNDRSPSALLLRVLFIKPWASQLTKPPHHHGTGSPRLKPPFLVRSRCNVAERQIGSIWLYDITEKGDTLCSENTKASLPKPKRMYYVAGGSWQAPPDDIQWKFLGDLLRHLEKPATVTLISCPLAPEAPAEVTFPLLEALYRALSADNAFENEEVCFAGDSSGGNIVLALVMHCLSQGNVAAPSSLILISPTVDISHQDEAALLEAEKKDPLESLHLVRKTAKAWSQDLDQTDPRLSPALGDIKILADHNVKVYGIIAGDDVLRVEAEEFVKHCSEVGVQGRFLLWEHQIHDFPIMSPYKIPESVKAMEWIALVLNECLKDTEKTHEKFEQLESESLKGLSAYAMPMKLFRDKKHSHSG